MKALVFQEPRHAVVAEREAPAIGPEDVLVRSHAVGICHSDFELYEGRYIIPVSYPIVPGHEWSGEVVEVGGAVQGLTVGDRVVGECVVGPGGRDHFGFSIDGANAEYFRARGEWLHRLPAGLSYAAGALVEPFSVAYAATRALGGVDPSDSVAVIGAGPIGLLALLVARLKGAGTIIVTDRSAHRLDLARKLGADVVVDVAEQDPIAAVQAATGGRGADAAIEAVGIAPTVQQALAVTRIGGNITWIGNSAPEVSLNMQHVVTREIAIRGVYAFTSAEFDQSIGLLTSGRLNVDPLIERIAPLADGPQLIHDLAKGMLDAVKVVLTP